MIDEVFRKNKTDQKIVDADERFLKISPLPDGSKVVDAKSSRIAYVADPKEDKDAINKSWAEAYFKKEKDAVTKLGESATAKSAEIDSKAKEVINTSTTALTEIKAIIDNFKGKQTELNVLKSSLEALKTSLEALVGSGVIDDTKVSTIQTYSSKKVEDLVNNAKTTLTAGINNQKQSITTLDSKINTTQSNLSNLATSVSNTLSQKVDATAYNTFATKVTNDLNNKANKNDVPSITSLEATFQKKTEKATDSDKLDGLDSTAFARKDTTDTQEFGSNLLVGTKVASVNEGGQIDFAAAPISGLGNSYIDVVSDRSGYANFRMMQRTSSNEFVGLVFPPVSGTIFSSGNMGVGSGLDAEKLGGMGYSSTNATNNIVQRDTNGDFASRWITASHFLMRTNAQDNVFDANSELCFRAQQTSEDNPSHMRFVTLAKLKELLGSSGFGTGQTLQDLTNQRSWNVTYENTTDKPIYVSVVTNSSSDQIALRAQLFINEMLVCENYYGNRNNAKQIATVCGIVPKGARYRVFTDYSGQTHIKKWFEFR